MGVNSLPSHCLDTMKVSIVLEVKSDYSKEFGMGKMLGVFHQPVLGYLRV